MTTLTMKEYLVLQTQGILYANIYYQLRTGKPIPELHILTKHGMPEGLRRLQVLNRCATATEEVLIKGFN
jgi:hypothetical protein